MKIRAEIFLTYAAMSPAITLWCAMKRSQVLVSGIHNSSGTSAIEFALVAPLFLLMVVGVIVFGVYLGVANSVQQLAADAARASVAGVTDVERASIARVHVASAASSFVLLDPAHATVTAQPSPRDANIFEVSVSYDASGLGIWAFSGLVPTPSKTIVRTSAIQRGGY